MPENNVTTLPAEKVKRQWRVGTFSMGTVLIVFGFVLLLAQFNNFSAVKLVSTWWPAVMIILGLEIIAALYFSKEDKPVINYDLLSIFMVLFIGGLTFGLYALTSVGILPALVETVNSRTQTVDVPEQRFALAAGVKNIVINASGPDSGNQTFFVQEASAHQVVAFSQAAVPAKSRKAAEALVPEGLVNARTVGDTLFLDFKSVAGGNHFQQSPYVNHTIILPRGKSVLIEADTGAPLKLKLNDLESSWAVNSSGTVDLTISRNANIKVEAFSRRLGGESEWIQAKNGEKSKAQISLVKDPSGNMTFQETADGVIAETKGKAAITFGQGSHVLKINAEEVIAGEI